MPDVQIIRSALTRIDDTFELQSKGRISAFILAVNIRREAGGLRAFQPNAAEALEGLARDVEAAEKDERARALLSDLHRRFRAWRRDTLDYLSSVEAREAAAKREADALEQARAEAPEVPAHSRPMTAAEVEEMLRAAREAQQARQQAILDELGVNATPPAEAQPTGEAEPSEAEPADAPAQDDPAPAFDDDDGVEMSMEEIERILQETTGKS